MVGSGESHPCSSCFPTKLRHFFRILMPLHIRERQLPIPKKFVCKFGKELNEVVFLKGPSGKVWPVELKKTDDGMVSFQNGWQGFVEYYSLQMGYFLAFRYDGNSEFKVEVFDRSACEKEYPYNIENVKNFNIDKEGRASEHGSKEDSVEILGVSFACDRYWTSPKDAEGKQQQPSKRNHAPGLLPRRHSSFQPVQPKVTKLENLTCETKSHKYRHEFFQLDSSYSDSTCKKKKVGRDHISILSDEGTRSEGFIQGTMSNCAKRRCKIDEFSIRSESLSSKSIMLEHGAFCNGDTSNRVERDCPEPTKTVGNVREFLPSVCNKFVQFNGRDLMKSAEIFDSRRLEQKSRIEELSVRQENHKTETKLHISSSKLDYSSTQVQGLGSYSRPFLSKGRPSRRFLSKRRPVTAEEQARASQEASAFKSSNPFFTVIMTRCHVYTDLRVHIPSTFVQKYLPRKLGNITLQASSGKRWVVGLHFSGSYVRTSKHWADFVWENNLEQGDVCIFELIKMEGTEMRVHIFRVVEELVPLSMLGNSKGKSWKASRGKTEYISHPV